jgi:hypothetical protein
MTLLEQAVVDYTLAIVEETSHQFRALMPETAYPPIALLRSVEQSESHHPRLKPFCWRIRTTEKVASRNKRCRPHRAALQLLDQWQP